MSFWSKMGVVADNLPALAGGFGLAWSLARATDDGDETERMTKAVAKSIDHVTAPVTRPALGALSWGADMLHKPYEYGVARPVSTMYQQLGPGAASPAGLAFDIANGNYNYDRVKSIDEWRKAWNLSEEVSPGQAMTGGIVNDVADMQGRPEDRINLEDAKQRQEFFENTWTGRLSSGTADAALNFVDPLVIGGKASGGVRAVRTTVSSSKTQDVLKVAAGELDKPDVGRRTFRAGSKIRQNIIEGSDGLTTPEMMKLPGFRDSADATTLAYLFGEANKIDDDVARHAAKRDVFGAALGDPNSIGRISARSDELSLQVKNLMDPKLASEGNATFSFGDHGQAQINFWNGAELDKEAVIRARGLKAEITRLNMLNPNVEGNIAGSTNQFALPLATRISDRASGLRESVMFDGYGGTPIRVVAGRIAGTRMPGHVDTSDPGEGFDHLKDLLGRSDVPAEERQKLLQGFIGAPTQTARNSIVLSAEGAIFRAAGAKHGVKPAEIEVLLSHATQIRGRWRSALKTRAYSAMDGPVMIRDHEGTINAFDGAFIQSQIRNTVPVTDPKMLDDILKREKHTRWLETLASETRLSGAATSLTNTAERANDFMLYVGSHYMNVWKFAALFRAAYPMRIQADSQARDLAAMGPLSYFMSAGKGVRNRFANERRIIDPDTGEKALRGKTSLKRSILKDEEKYQGFNIAPARNADDYAIATRLLGDDGSIAQIMSNMHAGELAEIRKAGGWDIVRGNERHWEESYLRAINHQFRNSPLVERLMKDSDNGSVAQWVRRNPEASNEWSLFEHSFDDVEDWVAHARERVNYLLPDAALMSKASERALTKADLAEHFPDTRMRMDVHGEQFMSIGQNNEFAKRFTKFRNEWYRLASDMPETVMARHPLYNARFRHHMRATMDRLGEGNVTQETVDAIRKTVSRKARKDVAATLFDLTKQSNASHTFRLFMPFFGAWEDTMKKWGRLFYEDTSRVAYFNQAWRAPNNAGLVVNSEGQRVDADGNITYAKGTPEAGKPVPLEYQGRGEYVMLPKALSPVPGGGQWKIDKHSVNIIFQGEPFWLPGSGPAVQVPVNELVKRSFPESAENPIVKWILPFGPSDDSWIKQLSPVPNWVEKAKTAKSPTSDDYRQTYTMLMAQAYTDMTRGDEKVLKLKKDGKLGEYVANQTRNWYILQAITSNVFPLSVRPDPKYQFYIDQAHHYQTQYGQDWQEKFYKDFPDYFDQTVSLSANTTGVRSSIRAYKAAEDPKVNRLIAENPELGWMYTGPENVGPFSQAVYTHQKTQAIGYGQSATWRTRRDRPDEAIKEVQAEKGWIQYNKVNTFINLELEKRGLHSISQKGAEDLKAAKKAYVEVLSNKNPDWQDAYNRRDSGKAAAMVRGALEAQRRSKDIRERPDMLALNKYLSARRTVRVILEDRAIHGIDHPNNADVKSAWDAYTKQLVAGNVGFEQMYNRVLENDDLSREL